MIYRNKPQEEFFFSRRNLWLSADHNSSTYNVTADSKPRKFRDVSEQMISDKMFEKLCNR